MEPLAQATVHIAAPAERVYDLLADLPSMGKWSPETVSCQWLDGATAAKPGVRFRGRNRLGWRRWSTTGTVVTADRGKELTWDVTAVVGVPVARWRYQIDADADGCRVTESMEDRRTRFAKLVGDVFVGVRDRGRHNQRGIEATLQKIKAAAEASS